MKAQWTVDEVQKLTELYPTATKEQVLKAIPKSWENIRHKASRLGIKRSTYMGTRDLLVGMIDKKNCVRKEGNTIQDDINGSIGKKETTAISDKYKQAIEQINQLNSLLEATKAKDINTSEIIIPPKSKDGESVAIMVASDWHVEEVVKPETISGMNTFNKVIAQRRAENFFRNGFNLLKITKTDTNINTIVLALLGDFISNNIHEDSAESNSMLPIEAVMFAQNLIASGIEFLLKNTDCNLIVPCCCGNHSRTTKKLHIQTEQGNSLEYYMYHNLASFFKNEKRVRFLIAEGYHAYLNIFGAVIRFHHGHQIKYQGGIGGITIPVNKAISQWDKMKRADLTVMGHYHQLRDGGNFICNGSLIGYNAYALAIKADYETPKQAYFLWNKKRGKTISAPIFLDIV